MPTFHYVARTPGGASSKGRIEAEDKAAAVRLLTDRQLFPVSVSEAARPGAAAASRRKIKPRRQADALRELADLVRAGVPLDRSLEVLAEHSGDPILRTELSHVRSRVNEGAPLADALAESALGRGDPLLVNIVRAGEAGGFLEDALYRHAEFIERSVEIRRRVVGQLAYPSVLAFFAVGAIVFLMVFFIPRFKDLFRQFSDRELPGPTAAVLNLSGWLQQYGGVILLVLAALAVAFWRFRASRAGRRRLDKLKLRLPLIGNLLLQFTIARFARTLGTLLKSGVPLLRAMSIARQAAGNRYIEQIIGGMIEPIERGESPSRLFADSGVFPRTVSEMMAVGEDTGEMDRVLLNIADRYEREAVGKLNVMVGLIEPAIIVLMAGLVGFVILSVILPLIQLQQML